MTAEAIGAFWVVSVLLALTPGADWAFAISAGLRERVVLPAVVGMVGGYLLLTALVAAGVGALLASEPAAISVISLVGAGYLAWLGVRTLTAPPFEAGGDAPTPRPASATVLRGFGISGLNPKALLLFVVLLPQFTDADAPWPVALQLLLLGAVHTLNCGIVLSAVGAGARTVLRARPTAAAVVGRVSGVTMIVLGALLVVEQLVHGG